MRLWQRKFTGTEMNKNPKNPNRFLTEGIIFPFSPTENGKMST